MENEVTLLGLEVSPYVARVRIALAEKGVEFASIEQDLSNKSPLLQEMNPVYKKIPVLIHKGRPICDSLIIVEYIAEVWNEKSPLLHSDPFQRARARFWAAYVDKVHAIGRTFWTTKNIEIKMAAKKDVLEVFKTLEAELGDKPYFGVDTLNIVDISLISFSSFFYTFETLGNFSLKAECPKLVEWVNRCMLKDSVSKSLCDPNKAYQVILQYLKKNIGEFE